jgi:hypothetical protein
LYFGPKIPPGKVLAALHDNRVKNRRLRERSILLLKELSDIIHLLKASALRNQELWSPRSLNQVPGQTDRSVADPEAWLGRASRPKQS